jgi:hypothetical protein
MGRGLCTTTTTTTMYEKEATTTKQYDNNGSNKFNPYIIYLYMAIALTILSFLKLLDVSFVIL